MTLDAALTAARQHAHAGRFADAERLLRDALPHHAPRADALSDLAMFVGQQGRLAEAEVLLAQAIALDPHVPSAWLNLAVALARQGRLDDSADRLRRARGLIPPDPAFFVRLAQLHARLGQPADGIVAIRRAFDLGCHDAEAHAIYATLLLLSGDFPAGWREYESRWRAGVSAVGRREFSDVDLATADLLNKRVALFAEQGFGDAIQFSRYATLVADRGADVTLVCPPELRDLLRWIPGVRTTTSNVTMFAADYYIPVMSLPRLFNTTLDTIPAGVPYITPPAPLIDKWRARLAPYAGLKVGIVWAGNAAHKSDADRSVRLELFTPLSSIPGITLFSLQKGPAAAQSNPPPSGLSLVTLTASLADFADTAGLISALDLVISVDTAVAHLAGAMGKPVWTLLPIGPDFRWLVGRADSPWYPTMRLFRQRALGNWDDVFRDVAAALGERAATQ